jgi:uncharacterized protein with PhoU and TrkA domain
VNRSDWLAGRTLGDLGLRDEGVVVLGLTRRDGRYLGAPTGATEVREGDVLIVYGRAENLRDLDERLSGPAGDRRHRIATARQEHEERVESAEIPESENRRSHRRSRAARLLRR